MSLRNYVQDGEFQGASPVEIEGVDTTSPLQALRPGFVRSAKNCRPGLAGGFVKREGYETVLTSAYGSRDVTDGFEFDHAGTKKLILFGTDRGTSGGQFGWNNGGSVTDISTGLSGTARPSFLQFATQLLFVNGSDTPVVWDGSSTKQFGITAPASAPGGTSTTGGSLNSSANYLYAYTYYNSTTKAESSPSDFFQITTGGSDTKVSLTMTAGTSTTADKIRIYRSVAFGQTLFYEGEELISATTHNSTIADSALGRELELDNTRLATYTATPDYPLLADQRIFIKSDDNEARFSKMGQAGPMYESFEVKSVINTSDALGDNNKLIGHAKAGNTVIALKEQSVGKYTRFGIPTTTLAEDNVIYIYEELTQGIQPIGHKAAVEVFGECIFLAKDNIYGTRGEKNDLRPLADSIQATIKSLGFTDSQRPKISSLNDSRRRLIYFQVFASSSDSTPVMTLVGDYQKYPNIRWTFYTQGTNISTHPGIVAASWFPVKSTTDGNQDAYFGNFALSGEVYHHTGNDDDGSGIFMEVITRPYAGPNPFTQKLWKKGFYFAGGDGTDFDITIGSIFDLSGEEELISSFSLFAGGAVYDSGSYVFDSAMYASNAVPRRTYDVHRKGALWQLVFRQTGADAPLTLYSWSVAGSFFYI